MSGIRTNAAAELLGVSPNTLRSWERRFGYPHPRRSEGGHRQYDLGELEALRRALAETHNISSAIDVARRRGAGPTLPGQLVEAFEAFDDERADRIVEESLAVRSLERTIEELLLPALEAAAQRPGREAEYEFGCRWGTGWLHAARRVTAQATREEGILLFDSSRRLGVEAAHVQALEVALRRAGFRVLLLSIDLNQERIVRAIRALEPAVIVLAGSEATLDVLGRLLYAARRAAPDAHVAEYRDATPVSGGHKIPKLGDELLAAVETLRALVDAGPKAGRTPPRATRSESGPPQRSARRRAADAS